MPPAIDAVGVTKSFGGATAVASIDIHIEPGTITGLIGPSGAGKTTIVTILTGLLEADEGKVVVIGKDPWLFTADDRQQIGYLPQDSGLYSDLTVDENLNFIGATFGLVGKEKARRRQELLDLFELSDAGDKKLGDLSGGMRRRVDLAAAIMHEPDMVFLDEPTAGLDPILRQSVWDHLRGLRESGCTILVTTQYVGEARH